MLDAIGARSGTMLRTGSAITPGVSGDNRLRRQTKSKRAVRHVSPDCPGRHKMALAANTEDSHILLADGNACTPPRSCPRRQPA